jgi:hypothetical protein
LQRRPTGIIRLELLSSPSSSSSFDLVLKVLFIIPARSFSSLSIKLDSSKKRRARAAERRERRERRSFSFSFQLALQRRPKARSELQKYLLIY